MTAASSTAAAADTSVVAAALALAESGWAVFPVATNKRPLTEHGLKDASTDVEQIRGWWTRRPNAGVAVRSGLEADLVVVDVDGEAGANSLFELERRHGELPETVRAETGGGGEHYYFTHPGGEIRSSAGKLGPGLDIRGDGGYVVCPPSPHPSGRAYAWDIDPAECALAPPPEWLVQLIAEERPGEAQPVSVWRELARNGVAAGTRNQSTAQLAGHLLARGVDPFVALELLIAWDARNQPPLGRDEVARTVRSIAEREVRKLA